MFYGKHTFSEFIASEERITTSVLADRLATLVKTGILTRHQDPDDRRREFYSLTDKGLSLIPVLVELAIWGVSHDPQVIANPVWASQVRADRVGLCGHIEKAVRAGRSVFCGEQSVIDQLRELQTTKAPGARV